MIRSWYLLKVGGVVVSETASFTDVLDWSSAFSKFGLNNIQIICIMKEN